MLAAVIGTGIFGLAATKSLLEEGIDVVAFEQRRYGKWPSSLR